VWGEIFGDDKGAVVRVRVELDLYEDERVFHLSLVEEADDKVNPDAGTAASDVDGALRHDLCEVMRIIRADTT
jgi:hypothetical protein